MFIDTHCHLSKKDYNDIDLVIKENIKVSINKMIISGCEIDSVDEAIEMTKKYDIVYATIGYHPDQASIIVDKDINNLENLLKSNEKILGIGEIGLDYHYDGIDKEKQKKLFAIQLKLAEKLDLPVIIHSRDASKDTIDILNKYKVKGIIHCFSGSLETANIYIKMGYKLGIGGVVTFKNSKLPDVIKNISLDNIVLETDSPYLTPDPYRGKINSSKYIPIIAEKISIIKNTTVEEVAKITTINCNDLFDFNR